MILAWRERLLQLVCFFRVKYTKCVEVLGTSDFELDDVFALLYLHRTCIFSSGCEKEILNFMYLLRLLIEKESGKENLNISIARLKKNCKDNVISIKHPWNENSHKNSDTKQKEINLQKHEIRCENTNNFCRKLL